jgi:hypothetical protein
MNWKSALSWRKRTITTIIRTSERMFSV